MTSSAGTGRRRVRDGALALLVAGAVLAALELALWSLGVADAEDPSRDLYGFDPAGAYIVPDPDLPGAWRTQFGLVERRGVVQRAGRIPPKGELDRVIVFGGSTAAGFQNHELSAALGERNAGKRFEVLNLAVQGYGSTRVSLVYQQALEHLEPDVTVIYTGDNEFIESVFKREEERREAGGWVQTCRRLARRSRTGRLIAGALARRDATRARVPDAMQRTVAGMYRDITLEETRRYYTVLEGNLRRMCANARRRDVSVVLCTVIYNRFAPPGYTRLPDDLEVGSRKEFPRLRARALRLVPEFLREIMDVERGHRIHRHDWRTGSGPDDGRAPSADLPGRRACFGPLAKADPMLGDPQRWQGKVFRHYDNLELLHARCASEDERERIEDAETLLERCVQLCPTHAGAHFELALVKYMLERDEPSVATHFELAADYDLVPRRSNRSINAVIRRVAGDFPAVLLFDADEIFAQRMPGRLTGYEWMADKCHLFRGAGRVLMSDLAQAIASRWP